MTTILSPLTPRDCAPRALAEAAERAGERDERFVWESLVPRLLHPVQLAIIEALLWIDRPATANDLVRMFGHRAYYLGLVSYHVKELAKAGVLRHVKSKKVRGVREHFYTFVSGS